MINMQAMTLVGLLLTVQVVDSVAPDTPINYTYQVIHVTDHGKTANEKFFLGPLPKVGESVEMVYVGDDESGGMRFQLRRK